jgi:membrane protease YdiL (CAAX protease family)
MVTRLFRRWFLEPWMRLNDEAAVEREKLVGFDPRPVAILIIAALVLVFQEYYGDRPNFDEVFGRHTRDWKEWYQLGSFAWWAGAKVVGYLVVPVIVVKVMGLRLRDCGLETRGFRQHAWIYGVLYLAIFPVVAAASYTKAFQATYPFYKLAARSWTDFFVWEGMYAATFLALEFFFRGFLLFPLKRAFGAYAIFVMIVPYCMIHFHKPVAEVVGAIFAGIVLGTLAMVTRSIWCGVLIHVSVAWTMDLLAMVQVYGVPGSGRVVP